MIVELMNPTALMIQLLPKDACRAFKQKDVAFRFGTAFGPAELQMVLLNNVISRNLPKPALEMMKALRPLPVEILEVFQRH